MGTTVQDTDMPLKDICMSSNDLISKKVIDCGGFGKVYLCCHRQHGLVVLKTVFTGFKQESYKNDLLQEGKIMTRLNHDRVVKLLGVILEDGNYSLVIEYMTKGNLLHVLKQTKVPISIKARFILEIIEGMVYLHTQKVIHKDLKPENILANDDFHVKIADLGVAAFQKWSSLTKEETNRQRNQSKKGDTAKAVGAGTLSYMAPEHLKSIHTKATEKSDVYSFAIVIWVILSDKEPYEYVINDVQLSVGVKDGQRPDITDDLQKSFIEATELMKECWKDDPNDRPTFQDCENQFRPLYINKYEKAIKQDMPAFKKSYPEPEAFVRRMASLQLDCDAEPPSMAARDKPMSLHSSLGLAEGNVDENLFGARTNEPSEHDEENFNETLHRKLQEEMNYHLDGSRIENVTNTSSSDTSSESRSQKQSNNSVGMYSNPPGTDRPFNVAYASDQPFTASPGYAYGNVSQTSDAQYAMPNAHHLGFNPFFIPSRSGVKPFKQHESLSGLGSFPSHDSAKVPVAESAMPNPYPHYANYAYASQGNHAEGEIGNNAFPKGNFEYSSFFTPEKSVNLTISNSRAVQIGNNNYMVVDGESTMKNRHVPRHQMQHQPIFQNNSVVNELQLQLLRENISRKWKEFARIVGFRQPEIDEIDYDYERDGLKEKVVQMLYKWQMKEGSKNATVGKIAEALYILEETDLLNKLIHLNQSV